MMREVTGCLLTHLGSGCHDRDGVLASKLVQQPERVRHSPSLAEFLRAIVNGR